jgi:hypothetical protein
MLSKVLVAVWVLDTALLVVSQVVAAGVAAIVGGDMAVAVGVSGHERRGWGLCWGAVS